MVPSSHDSMITILSENGSAICSLLLFRVHAQKQKIRVLRLTFQ